MGASVGERRRLVIPIVALLTVVGWLLAPWVANRFGVVLLCPLKLAWLMRRLPAPLRELVGAPGFPVLLAGLTVIVIQWAAGRRAARRLAGPLGERAGAATPSSPA